MRVRPGIAPPLCEVAKARMVRNALNIGLVAIEELEEEMPRYTVSVTRTLILTTNVTVRAVNADEAHDTVQALMEQEAFGVLAWDVEQCQVAIDDWQEDRNDLAITTVEAER